jgi:hypothetical protein
MKREYCKLEWMTNASPCRRAHALIPRSAGWLASKERSEKELSPTRLDIAERHMIEGKASRRQQGSEHSTKDAIANFYTLW